MSNSMTAVAGPGIVESKDGTIISYQTTGQGPGLILIHGVLSTAENYTVLAELLGKSFTVYSIQRRGRGLSGPQGNNYSIEKECEDIDALRALTSASYLFGHSFGGLIALEAARNNKNFKKIAVYEPPVTTGKGISTRWMPKYQKYLDDEKYLDAFAIFSIATGPENAKKTPFWLMKLLLPRFIRKGEREQIYRLLPANLPEHIEVSKKNNTYKNYQEISAEVLIMYGGKSNLIWVANAVKSLSEVLAVSEKRKFPQLDHFGPDKTGPELISENITDYFIGKREA